MTASELYGRGLIALGDSLTQGDADFMLGVRPLSWAHWHAETLDIPYTRLAANGSRAEDVLLTQVPRLHGQYEIACVLVGANNVMLRWDAGAFERTLTDILNAVSATASTLVLANITSNPTGCT